MKETKLKETNFCYRTEEADIYHVGSSKIHIFSSLEGFITEETCFKLSKVETSRILLPSPFYQDGKYVGCKTKWSDSDWIYAFYGSGITLKNCLIKMKEEILLLTELGYDLGSMPFYYSHFDRNRLTFDGTTKIRESDLKSEDLARKNINIYREYLRSLVYNSMSEFDAEPNAVIEYLYEKEEPIESRLEKALRKKETAGFLIRDDIDKKYK